MYPYMLWPQERREAKINFQMLPRNVDFTRIILISRRSRRERSRRVPPELLRRKYFTLLSGKLLTYMPLSAHAVRMQRGR